MFIELIQNVDLLNKMSIKCEQTTIRPTDRMKALFIEIDLVFEYGVNQWIYIFNRKKHVCIQLIAMSGVSEASSQSLGTVL